MKIRSLREAKGLTQLQLGDMAGLSRSQLSEIENMRKPANTLRLTAIARALGVSVEDLFEESPEETYRAVILDLMRSMPPEDLAAVIRHAMALAGVK